MLKLRIRLEKSGNQKRELEIAGKYNYSDIIWKSRKSVLVGLTITKEITVSLGVAISTARLRAATRMDITACIIMISSRAHLS